MTHEEQARALWRSITNEMLLAKKSGLNPRELALFTDKRAVEILATAIQDAERRVWEEAANKCHELLEMNRTDKEKWEHAVLAEVLHGRCQAYANFESWLCAQAAQKEQS